MAYRRHTVGRAEHEVDRPAAAAALHGVMEIAAIVDDAFHGTPVAIGIRRPEQPQRFAHAWLSQGFKRRRYDGPQHRWHCREAEEERRALVELLAAHEAL